MNQPDLFHTEQSAWVTEQLRKLGLKPGDEHYDGACQAAEQGWPAESIRPLIWPTRT